MSSVSNALRIASTAAWSDSFFVFRPIKRAEAIAAISVTRTTSIARLRSIVSASQELHHVIGHRGRPAFPIDAGMQRAAGAQNGCIRLFSHQIGRAHV